MSQSLSKIYLHLIFSTKNRECWLTKNIRDEMFSYIGGVINALDCKSIIVGGERDHIHTLFCMARDKSVSEVVREIKSRSSKWFSKKTVRVFGWQTGYGVFSVSKSQVDNVKKYIVNQEEHHRHKSFQEEFMEFLNAYDVEYDERYLWD